jgi:lipopolysaccharide export system permease protein
MRILDRYILKSFLVNYLLALGVLIGMYVLLDLIVNVQDFAKGAAVAVEGKQLPAPSTWAILGDMVDYYSYQLLVIFQQVSGVIPVMAAGFTMVRLTRHHELTAMLASGVSLYRVAAPIIGLSMVFALLNVVNQEFVISQPFVIKQLLRKHDEVNQVVSRPDAVNFVLDSDNSLLSAKAYDSAARQMQNVFIVQRDKEGRPIGHIVADTATWEIPEGETTEAWVMRGAVIESDRGEADALQRVANKVPVFNYRTGMTPAQLDLIFQKKAVDYLSSAQVRKLAEFSPDINKPVLYKIMHLRFTQPLMNIVMLLIGIPFLLTREPKRLVVNMFYCTAISGVVFIATFVIYQMGGSQIPDPMVAAWLPVLLFGPFALVMLDFIHT